MVELPNVSQKYQDVLKDAQEQAKLFNGIIDGCKNRIAMLMGEAAIGILPDGSAYTRKEQKRKAFEVAETSFIATRHTTKLPVAATKAIEEGTVIKIEDQS